ncbi:MAG: hypothetical protein HYY96_13590 [Candidatus Tectomicrobia bacterium]|nr:hypothetical protein [Candidatus Tectomicrobia bacterium]
MLETFGRAAGFLLLHLGTLAPIILTLTVPVELVRSYLMLQTELLRTPGLNLLIQYGTELPFHALVEPAFFMAVFALPTGRRLTVLDAYGEALRWWPRMFGVYVKLWVLTMLGFLLFVIPAIWIMVVFAFADLAALLDPERQLNPFSTSNRLVAGFQLRILGVVLLQLAASVLFDQILSLNPALLQVWWARALAGSAFAVVVRWFSIVLVIFYVRARLAHGERVPSFEELFPRLAERYPGVAER